MSQNQRQEVEGNRNTQVLCMEEINSCSGSFFWLISGLLYGVLHLPQKFEVCDYYCHLNYLSISVVTREMDGFTFQCAKIDYSANTEMLGPTTQFTVISSNSCKECT